jgi:crotonobetainyl-CoA:carnitine CoA-transferase CaiB-like acyl-CoA transferase
MWSLTNMGDTGNGFLAATAICQALYEREKTGVGQGVEAAIVSAQLFNSSASVARADGTAFERPQLDAMQTGFSAGLRLYPTLDGWLCLSLAEDSHWQALSRALDLPDLDVGGRLGSAAARAASDDQVAQLIGAELETRKAGDAFALLDAAGLPCEISSETAGIDLWNDPEAREHSWIAKYPHPMVQEIGQVGLALSLSDTPARVQGPPFLVGADTRALLEELGFDSARIDTLFENGAVNDEHVYPSLAEDGAAVESPWAPKAE